MYLCRPSFDPCMIHLSCQHLFNGSLPVSTSGLHILLTYFIVFHNAHNANIVSQISNIQNNVTVDFSSDIGLSCLLCITMGTRVNERVDVWLGGVIFFIICCFTKIYF